MLIDAMRKPQPKTLTVADLTERLGLPAHEQSTVASWTGKEGLLTSSPDGPRWAPVFSEADLDLYVTLWTRA
jgi:hypothetical protein